MRFDLHCHPSLKTWLFNQNLDSTHIPFKTAFIYLQVDCNTITAGKMDRMLVSHYLPEARIVQDSKILQVIRKNFNFIIQDVIEKVEKPQGNEPFRQTMDIIDHFEREVVKVDNRGKMYCVF